MLKKMLIDATHPEETRVVVMRGNKLEDFDFESAARQQLIGNIYLAKVTRVEPSLQAAFVEYGGNRHGFLAFSEIHPDYYQIPIADRQALLEADAAEEQRAENADEDVTFESLESDADEPAYEITELAGEPVGVLSDDSENMSHDDGNKAEPSSAADSDYPAPDEADDDAPQSSDPMLMAAEPGDSVSSEPFHDVTESGQTTPAEAPEALTPDETPPVSDYEPIGSLTSSLDPELGPDPETPEARSEEAILTAGEENGETIPNAEQPATRRRRGRGRDDKRREETSSSEQNRHGGSERHSERRVESVGGEDALDEVSRPRSRGRHYKIQEVIKKRQILLVQVLKDERGLKGAALTTYLSIPGRYCVLMPNTARGGGISRKIANVGDRKRLKAVAAELEVPEGMGLIIRTAGANRTKAEIKRDFEYLLRQWETIRELTLQSSAPCLINQEGSIIKRAVRDLYDKDIEDIVVEGEAGYREAKDFMRMLMPSHAKKVQAYRDPVPLFQRYQIEPQLDSMFDPTVRLKSGGYIVINPTEALVSIDVNSGKSTREANIEATALRTNMEAAEEVARQLRLRDLAGLIVIDFIDMENSRNDRAVERKIKDCLAFDRARIQVGRISPFGLLEMSRQRLRQGVVETTTRPCQICAGTGLVRSVDSLALHVLRAIEEEALKARHQALDASVPTDVAVYILNQKRTWLAQIEARFGISIFVIADHEMRSPNFEIKASDRQVDLKLLQAQSAIIPEVEHDEDDAEDIEIEAEEPADEETGDEYVDANQPAHHQRGRNDTRKTGNNNEQQRNITLNGEEGSSQGETDSTGVKRRRRRRRGGRDRGDRANGDSTVSQPLEGFIPGEHGAQSILPGSEPQPWISHEDFAASTPPRDLAVHAAHTADDYSPQPTPALVSSTAPDASTPAPEPKRSSWWQRRFGGGE